MKLSTLIILLGFTATLNSQLPKKWKEGEVQLTNGDSKTGTLKVRGSWSSIFSKGSHVVIFKDEAGKRKKYKYDAISKVIVNDTIDAEYVFYKRKKKKYQFFRILVVGDVQLLLTEMKIIFGGSGGSTNISGVSTGFGSTYTPVFVPSAHSSYWLNFNSYFVKKNGEEIASPLILPRISKPFKAKAKEYFKDCPSIINKIEDGTYHRKNLIEMVEDYNDGC